MKRLISLFPIMLLLCAGVAQAQLYKWTGPDGKVTYSDTPPPKAAGKVETRTAGTGSSANTADLPFELATATKTHPVTLYTGNQCAPCDEGRKLLQTRGVPFTEKTVNTTEDVAKMREAGGANHLPFLIVGRLKQVSFESGAWNSMLSAAGYPESSKLPAGYRNPSPEAAAPAPKTAEDKSGTDRTARAIEDTPPAPPNPSGIRF